EQHANSLCHAEVKLTQSVCCRRRRALKVIHFRLSMIVRSSWGVEFYLVSLSLAGLPINLLYWASSSGEHSISVTSKFHDCSLKGSLFRATHGFVYIFGSVMVTVSSNELASTW